MKLNKNMGTADRIIRFVIVIAAHYFTGTVSGILAAVLAILAVVFLVTSIFSFCPLYLPFKLSSRKKETN